MHPSPRTVAHSMMISSIKSFLSFNMKYSTAHFPHFGSHFKVIVLFHIIKVVAASRGGCILDTLQTLKNGRNLFQVWWYHKKQNIGA